jgi:hypothetical protein
MSDMEKPATPLPWKLWHGDIIAEGNSASDYDDYVIAGIGTSNGGRSSPYCPVRAHKPDGQANAAYIVTACNAYPHLTAINAELVEVIANLLEYGKPSCPRGMAEWPRAMEALARAKENSNGHGEEGAAGGECEAALSAQADVRCL